MSYLQFNLVFSGLACFTAFLLARRQLLLVFKVSLALTIFSYPWDYFAINIGTWRHPQPGPAIFGVPANELVFIFFATVFTTSVLLFIRGDREAQRVPNTEHAENHTSEHSRY